MTHRGWGIYDFGTYWLIMPPDDPDYVQIPFSCSHDARAGIDERIDHPERFDKLTLKRLEPDSAQHCAYCGGNCPNESDDSDYLCDGFAGDIDDLYKSDLLKKSSLALKKYANFIERFGLLNPKSKSPRMKKLIAYVSELRKMSGELAELAGK